MREINLKLDQCTKVPNKYSNDIIVTRSNDGYFITNGDNTFGPFPKVLVDMPANKQKDLYLYGWSAEKTILYRNNVFGLEQIGEINTEQDIIDAVNKFAPSIIQETLPGCTYLGETLIYKLVKDDTPGGWSKGDGFTRRLCRNERRLIYKTPENQIISVNPKRHSESATYQKFDSFDELRIHARKIGLDYVFDGNQTLITNRSLARFVSQAIDYNISDEITQNILDQIKTIVGIENFRNLDFSFTFDFEKHADINAHEYINALDNINIKDIAITLFNDRISNQTIQHIHPKTYQALLQDYAKKHIISTLPSTANFVKIHIKIGDEELTFYSPNNESVKNALTNPDMINWYDLKKLEEKSTLKDLILQSERNVVQEAKEHLRDENLIP